MSLERTRFIPRSAEAAAALTVFHPNAIGFFDTAGRWERRVAGGRAIAVSALDWRDAQTSSYDVVDGERIPLDALSLLVQLQRRTWGMPAEDLVPNHLLAITSDTGGATLVAYDAAVGFNADGWLGFVFGFGSSSGTLVSHMLGVRENERGAGAIGWILKMIQAHEALKSGHSAMSWTFDPMRGANARLAIEKLGATIDDFTIDKYGVLRSDLYGDVPSDRFTTLWDLLAPRTHERVGLVARDARIGWPHDAAAPLPELTPETRDALLERRPPRMAHRIPGDIDALMRADPQAAIRWRHRTRTALTGVLTTHDASAGADAGDCLPRGGIRTDGDYRLVEFTSGRTAAGERDNRYVLERRGHQERTGTPE